MGTTACLAFTARKMLAKGLLLLALFVHAAGQTERTVVGDSRESAIADVEAELEDGERLFLSCRGNLRRCSRNMQCCSANCDNGICRSEPCICPTCTANGGGCQFNSDCCSTFCDPATNQCAAQPAFFQCLADGAACFENGECCSTFCDPTARCAPQPTFFECLITGAPCTANGECCTSYCQLPNNLGLPINTCQQEPRAVGESCTANDDCATAICGDGTGPFCECRPPSSICSAFGTQACCSSQSCVDQAQAPGGVAPLIVGIATCCNELGGLCTVDTDCCQQLAQGAQCVAASCVAL